MRKIIASLDIGSSSIKLIVGEFIRNSLNILCVSELPSKGIKKGLISSKEELIPNIKEVFHKAEEMLGIPVKEVVLAVPAYLTDAFISEGSATITGEANSIVSSDIVKAMQATSYNKIPEDSELISVIPTNYKVDNEIVKNPLNMIGKTLTIKAVLLTVPKHNIVSFKKLLEQIGIKVISVVTSSLSDYALNKTKDTANKVGAVINIGSELTTVSIVNKGIVTKAEVIELGGNNVDNDIAYIYKITKKDACKIKEEIGLATKELGSTMEKVTVTDRMGEEVTIKQKELSEIIESRLVEILELSKKQMNLLTKREIEYIIITGGTTEMQDFNILCDKVFTKMHILGKIDIVGARNNKFSTGVGTIIYYNSRLKLKNKEYSVFNLDDLEVLSGNHKKVNINENSVLGKLFGYFFDN